MWRKINPQWHTSEQAHGGTPVSRPTVGHQCVGPWWDLSVQAHGGVPVSSDTDFDYNYLNYWWHYQSLF